MYEIYLAKLIYESSPLNRFRNENGINQDIDKLTLPQKLNLLCFSFQNYDKNYNLTLCLNYPKLWGQFEEAHWKELIIKMFPRKIKFEKDNPNLINSGAYFDILLLNGIIGVSPFEFIFEELEKKSFLNYLIFFGETNFYYLETELKEDIKDFYEPDTLNEIIRMKAFLIENSTFRHSKSYADLILQFGNR